jgi:chitin disaccharide deacetylase
MPDDLDVASAGDGDETQLWIAVRLRRLIVNADDFGRSHSINEAVVRAHREGILTTASLMVTGAAVEEAVTLARAHPRLGVGLHLTLVRGVSSVEASEIPDVVDVEGRFGEGPVGVGLRYYARRKLREPLRREVTGQFERFKATGLRLDHVNGHLHFHLHPTVLGILVEGAGRWGIRHVRLTRDELGLSLRMSRGRYWYRLVHGVTFSWLARRAQVKLRRAGIRHTDRVFGLLQDGRVDESYVLGLLARLPVGDSELYSHPSLDEFVDEFEALVSPRVRQAVRERGVELIRYGDM